MNCIRTSLTAASLAISTATPAGAETVASTCRLLSYNGSNTTVETFRCDFIRRGGNVMVNCAEHEFSFLAADQAIPTSASTPFRCASHAWVNTPWRGRKRPGCDDCYDDYPKWGSRERDAQELIDHTGGRCCSLSAVIQ